MYMAQLPASAAALEIQVAEVEPLSRSGGLQRRLRVAALATVLRCADVPSLTAAFSRLLSILAWYKRRFTPCGAGKNFRRVDKEFSGS